MNRQVKLIKLIYLDLKPIVKIQNISEYMKKRREEFEIFRKTKKIIYMSN